jgi:hypothetical protein
MEPKNKIAWGILAAGAGPGGKRSKEQGGPRGTREFPIAHRPPGQGP